MSTAENRLYTALSILKENGLERDAFMELYRESEELKEQMTADDCKEVFLGILKGGQDINQSLFEELCSDYNTSLDEVLYSFMTWREYVCLRAFENVFADLPQIEFLGFNSWDMLYDYIQKNSVEELRTIYDEKVYLVGEYAGAYLPELLKQKYIDIKYILCGVKQHNVNLIGIAG